MDMHLRQICFKTYDYILMNVSNLRRTSSSLRVNVAYKTGQKVSIYTNVAYKTGQKVSIYTNVAHITGHTGIHPPHEWHKFITGIYKYPFS